MTQPRELGCWTAAAILLVITAASAAGQQKQAKPRPPAEKLLASDPWAPPEVHPADPSAADPQCPLSTLLVGASHRILELSQNLSRFTATEDVTHLQWKKPGEWNKPVRVRFEYTAEIQQLDSGLPHLSESRDASDSLRRFPGGLATLGLPAMVMVFHPIFAGDFEMTCEGKSEWQLHPVWVISFQQRADRTSRLRAFIIQNKEWLVKTKGRAWLDATSFQVLHLETDLMQPIPEISLFRDHISLDYEPVRFQRQGEELYLPKRAEVYFDLRGHRLHRTHEFSNFQLFSVDVETKDKAPPVD